MCFETCKHFRCMTPEENARWDNDEIWLCSQCDAIYDQHGSDPFSERINNVIEGNRAHNRRIQ